jgi:hypothetical protein
MSTAQPTFTGTVTETWFEAKPSADTAKQLSKAWRSIWRENALYALDLASKGLGEPLNHLQNAVATVDLERKLKPRLFARLAMLMEAMRRKDIYAVYDIVQAWQTDPPETWATNQIKTESIAIHSWEQATLAEARGTKVNPASSVQLFPLLEADLEPVASIASEALDKIGQVDKAMLAEIDAHVSLIKLFKGRGIEGFSSPKSFGAVWLQLPQTNKALAWFLEHLVHECSHLHLNALLAIDPLLLNPNELHQAPIRPDPRPLFQVLHGTFVLARNCRVHRKLISRWPRPDIEASLSQFESQFLRGLDVLKTSMKPTPLGQHLLNDLEAELES